MRIRHLVVATDESEAGRQAVWTAVDLAARTCARVTVMRTLPMDGAGGDGAVEQLRRWVESDLPGFDPTPSITYAVAYGVPGIEIGRFAEGTLADLLVLGHKTRSRAARLLVGDTADAVARRSRLPCLFVPGTGTPARRMLVAIDASTRGRSVLTAADELACQIGAELRVVTVQPAHVGEPAHLALATPTAGSRQIESQVQATAALELEVRHGDVTEQILEAARVDEPDVLAIGCHRGGPAGVIEGGSTARRVMHQAPCAVLTVPL